MTAETRLNTITEQLSLQSINPSNESSIYKIALLGSVGTSPASKIAVEENN
jgi:hypothetical protein